MSYRQEIVGGYFLLVRPVEGYSLDCIPPPKHWCCKIVTIKQMPGNTHILTLIMAVTPSNSNLILAPTLT